MKYIHVEAPCGRVKGIEKDDVCIFRGIPYAYASRWKRPSIIPQLGDMDCTAFGKACYQEASFYPRDGIDRFCYDLSVEKTIVNYGEACLNLNITTPSSVFGDDEQGRRPVLVFFHGGAFDGGCNAAPELQSTAYAEHGIILVTVNFRLNAFASHALGYNGNLQLRDAIVALEWVNKYISAFGGDPNQVTIAGESSGALMVQDLMYAPKARGLFRSAIMMSSGGLMPPRQDIRKTDQGPAFWKEAAKMLDAKSVKDLTVRSAEEIYNAYRTLVYEKGNNDAARPYVDGDIIPESPEKLRDENRFIDVPCLMTMLTHDMYPCQLYDGMTGWARFKAEKGLSHVYCAMFDYSPGGTLAEHATDLHYAFGTLDNNWHDNTEEDYKLSERIITRFSEFIKTGKLRGWVPVMTDKDKFMFFDYSGEHMEIPDRDILKEREETEPQFPGTVNNDDKQH